MTEKIEKSPAVVVAQEQRHDKDDIYVLSSGVRVRFHTVSLSLIEEITSRIKYPPIPEIMDEDKGRTIPNPMEPAYIAACDEADTERGRAVMDAMVLFGVELVDGVPDNDTWIKKLLILQKLRGLNLSAYDLSDPLEAEFVYVRFVALGTNDMDILRENTVLMSEEDVVAAEETFPSDDKG